MRPLAAIQRLDATIPAQLLKDADPNPDARSRLDEIMLLRASPQPRKIFGVAVNYRSPASADAAPAYPVLCSKFWSLTHGPGWSSATGNTTTTTTVGTPPLG